jgi:copper chaperone
MNYDINVEVKNMCQECGCHNHSDAVVLKVEGMTCGHCTNAVEKAVNSLPGVSSSSADLKEGTITINFDSHVVGLDAIKKAIVDTGYQVG